MKTIEQAIDALVAFRDERDWKQFHTPKNLAAALAIEAAELQETMLWKSDDEVAKLLANAEGRASVSGEIADVLIYALLLCHSTGIDPLTAIAEKLEENRQKYPADISRGKATKYTDLPKPS